MEISEMTNEQLESRSAAILTEMEGEGADLNALQEEARAIRTEMESRAAEQQRQEIRAAVAAGNGTVIRNIEEEHNMPEVRTYNAASPEYRTAWLRNMAVIGETRLFGELNEEERAAFTFVTTNTGAVVPTDTMNRIVELVESMSPMYDDAQRTNMVRGFGIPRHTAITAGDAKGVKEGTANDDEQDTFDLISLAGIEIKKHVVISRKMQFQSIDAFETWVVNHLAARISVARERAILARLDGTAPDGGTAVAAVGINSANKLTAQKYDDATMRKIMSLLKGTGVRVVYANSATIWNKLAGIENGMGQKLFIPSTTEDPINAGRIYGATVKTDENLADDTIYVIVKNQLIANDFDQLEIIRSIEAKTANTIILGYAIFDAGLENDKGAVKATFSAT